MEKNIFEQVYQEFATLLLPVEIAFESTENFAELLGELGWYAPSGFFLTSNQFPDAIKELKAAIKKIDIRKPITSQVDEYKKLAKASKKIIQLLSKLKDFLPNNLNDFVGDYNKFKSKIGSQIIDYLFCEYLENERPFSFNLLKFLGILEIIDHDFSNSKPAFTERIIYWRNFSRAIYDFSGLFKTKYNWNSEEEFSGNLFLDNLESIFVALDMNAGQFPIDNNIGEKLYYNSGQQVHPYSWLEYSLLNILIFEKADSDLGFAEFGIQVVPIPDRRSTDKKLKGVSLIPYAGGEIETDFQVSENSKFIIGGNSDAKVGINIIPGEETEIIDDLLENSSNFSLGLKLEYSVDQKDSKVILFGKPKGTRLDYKNFRTGINIEKASNSKIKPSFFAQLNDASFIFEPADGDGFIKKVLKPIDVQFELMLSISEDGITFGGAAGFEKFITLNKKLGPVKINTIHLGLSANKDYIKFFSTAGFDVELGPIFCSIDRIGIQSKLLFDTPGILGNQDLDFGFKPPNEIAIKIKSGLISGGGFLEFDYENHRYSGILSLNMKSIELTAIGLITTKLPNNRKGFSMLVSIGVIFNPAIQLSFGFTLNGVGGLIGVNRTMNVQALRERFAKGAVESIMFPKDPIKNADKIISDLRSVFPAKHKHFVIAPFLRIGWGAPTLIEVDLGVVMEFPFKGRLILIGSLGIYLPAKKAALTEIHVDVLGDFNFAEEYIRIEGIIRNSHIVGIPLNGGFAFVLSWDRKPQFLLSVGGYHPRYKKPARFPAIPRLSTIIQRGSKLKLTCEYYQAITSNSYQLGFRADLYMKAGPVRVTGYFSFDALLQFNPFFFEVEISMGVHIKYKSKKLAGVDLYFLLSGPRPWKVKGRAKIKIAFFKIKVRFKLTWGKKQRAAREIISSKDILKQLQGQLELPQNWTSKLPKRFKTAETLRSIEAEELILLHPSGYLEVRQTVVPLNQRIEKFGNKYFKKKPVYSISKVQFGTGQAFNETRQKSIKEFFARGQFIELTDAQKISSADFEEFNAGLEFGGITDYEFGKDSFEQTDSQYENIIINEDLTSIPQKDNKIEQSRDWENNKFTVNKSSRVRRFREEPEEAFKMVDDQFLFDEKNHYYIVSKIDFSFPKGLSSNDEFLTKSKADEYLKHELSDVADQYIVMSVDEYEMNFSNEPQPV